MKEEEKQGGDISEKVEKLLNEKPKKKKGKKKWIFLGLLLLFVLFILKNLLFPGKATGMLVNTESLSKADIQEKLSVSGPVSGTQSQHVTSALHAKVKEILVKEGDKVTEGQLIAKLDTKDVEEALEAAKTQVDLAKANKEDATKNAKAEYAKVQTAYNNALLDFQRKSSLLESGDISQSEYEQAESALKDAKASLGSFKVSGGNVQVSESYDLQIKSAEEGLKKAQSAVDSAEIKAPISGTITRVNVEAGQFADNLQDGKPMFTVENLDQLELSISVSEYSIGKLSLGQKAIISADILGDEKLEGEVSSISPTGEQKNGTTAERVIPIKITIDGDKKGLISGITAKADIVLSEAKDVFVVPLSAVITGEDGSSQMAFVEDGKIHIVPVKTGVESDVSVEVSPLTEDASFKEGAHFVSAPDASLTEGMDVTEMPKDAPGESVSAEENAVIVKN
jgi:efflux transporter, RND family, MFP subunit